MSLMVSVPFRVPVCVGVKVTLRVQLPPAAMLPPQLPPAGFVEATAKSLVPVEILATVIVAVPTLESVTCCAALVVFNIWPVKAKLDGEIDASGTGVLL